MYWPITCMDSLNYLNQAGGPLPIHNGQKHRLASLPGIRERHTTRRYRCIVIHLNICLRRICVFLQ